MPGMLPMTFQDETEFLKAFEVAMNSDVQVYLILSSVANILLFIIIFAIAYWCCLKGTMHRAMHSAIAAEMARHHGGHGHESHNEEEALLYPTPLVSQNTTLAVNSRYLKGIYSV